ncbi:hypothetical protein KY289_021117 [Solanum tuberosum]|nr:hypothetical protein KY289_021117 [Solanum tuberosum]
MLNPLPTINHAYAMIAGDESQKAVMSHNNSMGMNTISADSVAMYSKSTSTSGHSKEYCYKIVGYPPDFKSKGSHKVPEWGRKTDSSQSDHGVPGPSNSSKLISQAEL